MIRTRLLCAVLLAALLFTTGGCKQQAETSPAADQRIVFKHGKIFGDNSPLRTLLRRFEAENPGVTVVDEELPSSTDEQHQFYVINLQGESADFDVLALDVIWISEFARAGWLLPLDAGLPIEDRADFFDATIQAVTFNGQVYALPWVIGAGLLYYRRDLLEKYNLDPPQTWEELILAAEKITAAEDHLHGFLWQGKQYEGLVCNTLEYLWSHGGTVLSGGASSIVSDENLAGLRLMRSLVYTHGVTPDFVTTLTEEPSRRLFGAGRAVFMRNWPYAWSLYEDPQSPVYGKVGVTTLPRGSGGEPAATLGGWHLGVNAFSRNPRLAERLAAFLTSRSSAKHLAMQTGHEPTRRSLYSDPELLAKRPFKRKLKEIFETARPRPVTPYYMMISQILQREFSAVLSAVKTPEKALADAQTHISHILSIEDGADR